MKKIVFLIAIFTGIFAFGQQEHSGGIPLTTGFKLEDPQPIDDKYVVADSASLNSLPNVYEGLWSYSKADSAIFVYGGVKWDRIAKGGDLSNYFTKSETSDVIEDSIKKIVATPEQFKTDSNTWTDAIQLAIDSDAKTIMMDFDYTVSHPIYVPSNKTIVINGTVKPVSGVQTTLTGDGDMGDSIISVTDASNFLVGQEIIIADDLGEVNESSGNKYGQYAIIEEINGNDITLDRDLDIDVKVSENAILGTFQSVFLVKNAKNVKFTGIGLIDGNKSEQLIGYDPVIFDSGYGVVEATFSGCAIGVTESSHISIENLNFTSSPLHNVSFFDSENIKINGISATESYYKNVLLFRTNNTSIDNVILTDSEKEDGLTIYRFNTNVKVNNITTSGNERAGIIFSTEGNENVDIDNFTSTNDVTSLRLYSGKNIRITNFHSTGATGTWATSMAGENIFLSGKIEAWTGAYGVGVRRSARNITLELTLVGNLEAVGNNVGLIIEGNTSGVENVYVRNSTFLNCKKALYLYTGTIVPKNVIVSNNVFESNTITLDNQIGTNALIVNNIGLADYPLTYIPTSEKGANNGVATLDGGGKITAGQLPSGLITNGADSEETIEHLSIKSAIGSDENTIYFVPKAHQVVKAGQLQIFKKSGNTNLNTPEAGDYVQGFMTDSSNDEWFLVGIYVSGNPFKIESYTQLNGTTEL